MLGELQAPNSTGVWLDRLSYILDSMIIHLRSHGTAHAMGIILSPTGDTFSPWRLFTTARLFTLYVSHSCVLLGFWEDRGIWLVEGPTLTGPVGYFYQVRLSVQYQINSFHHLRSSKLLLLCYWKKE